MELNGERKKITRNRTSAYTRKQLQKIMDSHPGRTDFEYVQMATDLGVTNNGKQISFHTIGYMREKMEMVQQPLPLALSVKAHPLELKLVQLKQDAKEVIDGKYSDSRKLAFLVAMIEEIKLP